MQCMFSEHSAAKFEFKWKINTICDLILAKHLPSVRQHSRRSLNKHQLVFLECCRYSIKLSSQISLPSNASPPPLTEKWAAGPLFRTLMLWVWGEDGGKHLGRRRGRGGGLFPRSALCWPHAGGGEGPSGASAKALLTKQNGRNLLF